MKLRLYIFLLFVFYSGGGMLTAAVAAGKMIQAGDPQDKCEQAVQTYIRNTMKNEGMYKAYSFGSVEIIVPKEIIYLEELKKSRAELATMGDRYGTRLDSMLRRTDTLIASQERIIAEKHIRNMYKINHLFTFFNTTVKDKHKALECRFYLSANFKVMDVHVLMSAELDDINYDWFHYYVMQLPLFKGDDEDEVNRRSYDIYNYFNKRMSSFDGDKDALLKSTLVAVRLTQKFNRFDPELIAKGVVIENYFRKPGYKALDFSVVNALTTKVADRDTLLGYSLFHKFSSDFGSVKDSVQCHYFELDPWFVIAGSQIVMPPFEKYFLN
jgi:hypothetical protein